MTMYAVGKFCVWGCVRSGKLSTGKGGGLLLGQPRDAGQGLVLPVGLAFVCDSNGVRRDFLSDLVEGASYYLQNMV